MCMPTAYLLGDDMLDYDIYHLNEVVDIYNLNEVVTFSDDMLTFKYEQSLPLEFWRMRFYVYPNTFVWYKWQDYDKAIGFKKIYIFEEIKSLTIDRK